MHLLETEWTVIGELVDDLDEQQWKLPTDLPGWTVQDNLSHIVGTELMLLGEPAPEVDVRHLPHVRNPFAAAMEPWIEARRGLPGEEVLQEYHRVIERRLEQLEALTTAAFEKVGWSPVGEVPYRDFMVVRVFDCWMHEQDMRRALGRPGHLSGPVVDTALTRFEAALGFVVGKKAGALDGSSVVFVLEGEPVRRYAVVVEGRAKLVAEPPVEPTVRLTMPLETFVALGGGRRDAVYATVDGGARIEGDDVLGRAVLASLAFTP